MSNSGSYYGNSVSKNRTPDSQECDLTLQPCYISPMIIAPVEGEAEAHNFLLLALMKTAQACWPNISDSIKLIPLCLAMWAFSAVLLQIQLPRSHLQGDLRSERALHSCICSWFLTPFWQAGLNHFQYTKLKVVAISVQVLQSSFSFVRREEGKSCSTYLSQSPDTWPFFWREIQPLCIVEYPSLWLNAYLIINMP